MEDISCIIVLDFDGTVVTHRYPDLGEDIGAVPVLKLLIKNGHKIILNTMRSHDNQGQDMLAPALKWFKEKGIPLYGVNENPAQKSWTSSPKIYGNIYIDDGALGIPLKLDKLGVPYVDWGKVSILLFLKGLLSEVDIISLLHEGIIDQNSVKITS